MLKVRVSGGVGEPRCLVTFPGVLGYRVLDERDLLEYWPVCSTPAGWLFRILSGGWLEQERSRPGSLIHDAHSDVREYLVASMHECVSVFAYDEPTLAVDESGRSGCRQRLSMRGTR
jgi:hypothetical protein